MSIVADRPTMEAALVRALSRHIGHTTGAYDLDRILSVLDFFRDRSSAYKEEILAYLRDQASEDEKTITEEYLSEVLTFARSFGVIELISGKEVRLQKYSCPELGRSILAAKDIGNDNFFRFFKARTVFLADSDSLVAVLSYFDENRTESLQEYYVQFFLEVRKARYDWLRRAFPEPMLLTRITDRLTWLSGAKKGVATQPKIDAFTLNTARHHSTPRKGWLSSFEMLDSRVGALTEFGRRALQSLIGANGYFWLAPPRGMQELLRISPPLITDGPFEDEFAFVAELAEPGPKDVEALIPDVAEVMIQGYPSAKLIHASQASVQLPIEYTIYRSYTDGMAYDALQVLDAVFHRYRDQIDRLSAFKGKIGFYRVK